MTSVFINRHISIFSSCSVHFGAEVDGVFSFVKIGNNKWFVNSNFNIVVVDSSSQSMVIKIPLEHNIEVINLFLSSCEFMDIEF